MCTALTCMQGQARRSMLLEPLPPCPPRSTAFRKWHRRNQISQESHSSLTFRLAHTFTHIPHPATARMLLGPLTSVSSALRSSTSRLLPSLRASPIASSSRNSSYALIERLGPAPGAVHKKQRVGRGNASKRGGHTSGRGHKGAKGRSGKSIPYLGFEGGQTPLFKRIPKRGFTNLQVCPLRGMDGVLIVA